MPRVGADLCAREVMWTGGCIGFGELGNLCAEWWKLRGGADGTREGVDGEWTVAAGAG